MKELLKKELYIRLQELGIKYEIFEHEAVWTMEGAAELDAKLPGYSPKNMLVKDKKSKEFYLVVLEADRKLNEKELAPVAGWSKIRFASADDLMDVLGLEPGSVSPLAIIKQASETVIGIDAARAERIIDVAEGLDLEIDGIETIRSRNNEAEGKTGIAPNKVKAVVFDKLITAMGDDALLTFHPCRNTASLVLSKGDMVRFLESIPVKVCFE